MHSSYKPFLSDLPDPKVKDTTKLTHQLFFRSVSDKYVEIYFISISFHLALFTRDLCETKFILLYADFPVFLDIKIKWLTKVITMLPNRSTLTSNEDKIMIKMIHAHSIKLFLEGGIFIWVKRCFFFHNFKTYNF